MIDVLLSLADDTRSHIRESCAVVSLTGNHRSDNIFMHTQALSGMKYVGGPIDMMLTDGRYRSLVVVTRGEQILVLGLTTCRMFARWLGSS